MPGAPLATLATRSSVSNAATPPQPAGAPETGAVAPVQEHDVVGEIPAATD